MAGLQVLEILYIHDNRLSVLPSWLGSLRALTYLNVARTGCGRCPSWRGWGSLIELRRCTID